MKVIYDGGYIPDLAICEEGDFKGWLMFKHPDGQWVSAADLKPAAALMIGVMIKAYDEAPADAEFDGNHPILMVALERDAWMKRLNKVINLVNEQAKDEGLWFVSQYASEAYLQDALRKLHAVVEDE